MEVIHGRYDIVLLTWTGQEWADKQEDIECVDVDDWQSTNCGSWWIILTPNLYDVAGVGSNIIQLITVCTWSHHTILTAWFWSPNHQQGILTNKMG